MCPTAPTAFSRRRRTYIRVPKTDLGYFDFQVSEVTLIFGNLRNLKNWWAAKECVDVAPDAAIRSGVGPGMVSKD